MRTASFASLGPVLLVAVVLALGWCTHADVVHGSLEQLQRGQQLGSQSIGPQRTLTQAPSESRQYAEASAAQNIEPQNYMRTINNYTTCANLADGSQCSLCRLQPRDPCNVRLVHNA